MNHNHSDLDDRLERAAEIGARRALESLGFNEAGADKDFIELRNLLESWRTTKRFVAEAIVKWFTVAVLGAISISAFFEWGKKK